MSHQYRLRIDMPFTDGEKVTEWVTKFCDNFLVVSHTDMKGNNHHFHLWLVTKLVDISVRSRVRSLDQSIIGNKRYSLSPCDSARTSEYLTYMFNLKNGNIPRFISQKGLPDWETFKDASAELTLEYQSTKKQSYSKNDCITDLLQELGSINHTVDFGVLFDKVISRSRQHGVVFSINAIREIIMYVAYCDPKERLKTDARYVVLQYFDLIRT